jgi:hypothetical protein
MRAVISIALAGLLLAACGKHDQTYAEALALFCDAPNRAPAGTPADGKISAGVGVVQPLLTNPEARHDVSHLADVEHKVPEMEAMVKRAGLDQCAILDAWRAK